MEAKILWRNSFCCVQLDSVEFFVETWSSGLSMLLRECGLQTLRPSRVVSLAWLSPSDAVAQQTL